MGRGAAAAEADAPNGKGGKKDGTSTDTGSASGAAEIPLELVLNAPSSGAIVQDSVIAVEGTVSGPAGLTATVNGANVYTGTDYRLAIQTALDRISSGQRVTVRASGSIGANMSSKTGKGINRCMIIDA